LNIFDYLNHPTIGLISIAHFCSFILSLIDSPFALILFFPLIVFEMIDLFKK